MVQQVAVQEQLGIMVAVDIMMGIRIYVNLLQAGKMLTLQQEQEEVFHQQI